MDYTRISQADKTLCEASRRSALQLDHNGVIEASIQLLQRRYQDLDAATLSRAKATVINLRGQMRRSQ